MVIPIFIAVKDTLVNKENLEKRHKQVNRNLVFGYTSVIVMMTLIAFFLVPNLKSLFEDLDNGVPFHIKNYIAVILLPQIVLLLLSLYINIKVINTLPRLIKILEQKSGEVYSSKLFALNSWLVMFTLLIVTAITIFTVFLPIYRIEV